MRRRRPWRFLEFECATVCVPWPGQAIAGAVYLSVQNSKGEGAQRPCLACVVTTTSRWNSPREVIYVLLILSLILMTLSFIEVIYHLFTS